LGLLANIGGGLIHILLVVAVVVLIFHFIQGRSRVGLRILVSRLRAPDHGSPQHGTSRTSHAVQGSP
jgi:hypothetical protein